MNEAQYKKYVHLLKEDYYHGNNITFVVLFIVIHLWKKMRTSFFKSIVHSKRKKLHSERYFICLNDYKCLSKSENINLIIQMKFLHIFYAVNKILKLYNFQVDFVQKNSNNVLKVAFNV